MALQATESLRATICKIKIPIEERYMFHTIVIFQFSRDIKFNKI